MFSTEVKIKAYFFDDLDIETIIRALNNQDDAQSKTLSNDIQMAAMK